MNKGLVLIADEMHPSLMPMLEKIGYKTDYQPKITRSEIIEKIGNYDGLIIRSKTFVDAELLTNAKQLKFIGRAGAGLDLIDIAYVESKNIAIFAANEGNRVAVAEHVLGMVLCLMNNILIADREVRNGIWQREKNRGYELMGKTVGLIGYGNNGKETAKRFKAFGCKVLAYDKYKSNFSDEFVSEASMEMIFEQADIVSLHIPLTNETNKLVNAEFLSSFKNDIILINAARGEIVSLRAVVENLETGKIKGACLDVLENEKLQKLSTEQQADFENLSSSERVILTPHIAGWTFESYVKINEVLVEKIASLI
ncbi:2-hydroxyacid dehydrogenase [Emticicia aquatilis]|uniref:2-hydroxyacid dehydrogenase n=1 Tax=Emticicia aquatilis TaxID=1537369 RepID=A0A916YRQ5_9BACT|nr:2-hydroxyacid dehydrogenase [Emticicia aquatilis]GGD56557.1 2-hydroxyacid dehydrogenase [Emticicia aquatilis]